MIQHWAVSFPLLDRLAEKPSRQSRRVQSLEHRMERKTADSIEPTPLQSNLRASSDIKVNTSPNVG